MKSYIAKVIATYMQGEVKFTTYVGAKSPDDAKRKLQREGFEVISVEEFAHS